MEEMANSRSHDSMQVEHKLSLAMKRDLSEAGSDNLGREDVELADLELRHSGV